MIFLTSNVLLGFFTPRTQPLSNLGRVFGHKYTSRRIAFREKFTDYYRTWCNPIPWVSQGCVPWMSLRYKSRDITLLTKVCLVKAMLFPVVIYGCESWTIKKAEWRRIHAFELWCWKRLLRVPWTARKSNQSTLKNISPEYSLEGLMLKLKLQYFGHLMQKTH